MIRCLSESEWDKIVLMEEYFKINKIKHDNDLKRVRLLINNILEISKFICRHKKENTSMCYCNECPISILEEKSSFKICFLEKRFKKELFKEELFKEELFKVFDPEEKEKENG